MTELSLRAFFKKVVGELKGDRDKITISVLTSCSSRPEWFQVKGKHSGKYAHYTDDYIDTTAFEIIESELILLIADYYQQR